MATRVRESGVRGKEKKGSQVDHSMPSQQQKRSTTTTSRLMSSANSVPNYLRPTTASSAVQNQAAGDKPHPSRRKSLDRPLPHLDTHRNLAGDKPSVARRKSFDRPIPHSSLSSSSSSAQPNKPTFSRTKSSLDKPKPSTIMSRSSEANDRRGKMMTRSISSIGRPSASSSSISHHHLKPVSDRPTMAKSQRNSARKQPGTTTLSSKPVKKKPAAEIITNNHQEPSVTESADHHTEAITDLSNNNSSSKIVQEKESIVVSDHEELEDLKSIEDCSLLVPEDPSSDLIDTIIEEGDEEPAVEISVPEKLQESGESADTVLTAGDPHGEDNDGGESNNINNLKETTASVVDPKSGDEVSVEEKGGDHGDENMQPTFNNSSDNCNEDKGDKQEKEEERETEKDKKADYHHHQEQAEEVKETTDDQKNSNNNNVVAVLPAATIHQSSEGKPAQSAGGKKNESVVSNDVIEETASKLREQRKNKVKALAGAFETVISLQDK